MMLYHPYKRAVLARYLNSSHTMGRTYQNSGMTATCILYVLFIPTISSFKTHHVYFNQTASAGRLESTHAPNPLFSTPDIISAFVEP
jgi:hypothetical protein